MEKDLNTKEENSLLNDEDDDDKVKDVPRKKYKLK